MDVLKYKKVLKNAAPLPHTYLPAETEQFTGIETFGRYSFIPRRRKKSLCSKMTQTLL